MKNTLMMVLCLCLIGCVSAPHLIEKPFVEPEYGMTKQQMLNLLGKPESIEIYKKIDLTRVEYYIYLKKYETSQEKIPVCLINNRIVGWGKSYYEDHVRPDDLRIK